MTESTEQLIRGIDGRMIRMETVLEGIAAELKKGDDKFRRFEMENEQIKRELSQIREQLSYWKGGLAIVAIIWPIIIGILTKYLFG